MNHKIEIQKLREDIESLQQEVQVTYKKGFTKTEAAFSLQGASHMKMLQGPWQRLGITIDQMMSCSIKHLPNAKGEFPRDYTFEMTVDEAIKTAKSLCEGFFDTWEKELDLLQFNHFSKLKQDLLDEKGIREMHKIMEVSKKKKTA